MRSGELRHRVTIQQKTVTRNDYHDEVIAWTDVDSVWAAIEPLQGREFIEARRAGAEQPHWIRLRYRDDVTPAMRIVWGAHTYDIESVVDLDGRQRELRVMCNEVLNE